MCFEINDHRRRNTAMITSLLVVRVFIPLLLAVPVARAVELQAARELVSSCALPVSENDMVDVLAAELVGLPNSEDNQESTMAVIYTALQQHGGRGQ